MASLHEMAIKLQEFIMEQQRGGGYRSSGYNPHKYNNMKLRMDSNIDYPHVIISIGISEAIYNVKDVTKIDGGLGSDEKYVRKWLSKVGTMENLVEIYKSLTELTSIEDEAREEQEEELRSVIEEAMANSVRNSNYEQNRQRDRLRRYIMTFEDADEDEGEDIDIDKTLPDEEDNEADKDSDVNTEDEDEDIMTYSFDDEENQGS